MGQRSPFSKRTISRRRRFQRGSLQKRKSSRGWHWIAFWWENHRRRSQILGPCSTTSRSEALAEMARLLLPVNAHAGEPIPRSWTVADWIEEGFLPFIRRRWKSSTASTSGDRIRKHLIADFETVELPARGLSFSVVDHLRWDLRTIFRLAVQDRLIPSNPAEMLFTPRTVTRLSRRVLDPDQVQALLKVLDLREQLIVHLALFSGMRPGEILALQWKHVTDDHVRVAHRLYRGKFDRPKTERSQRKVALSKTTRQLIREWRLEQGSPDLEAWVFVSANGTTPLGRDSVWRWRLRPRLKAIGLEWATFQIMRRTHASLSRQAGIDPKLVADQLGHGLGVNLDVYIVTGLDQRRRAVDQLETTIVGSGRRVTNMKSQQEPRVAGIGNTQLVN